MNFAKAKSNIRKKIQILQASIAAEENDLRTLERIESGILNDNPVSADHAAPNNSVNHYPRNSRKAREGSLVFMAEAAINSYSVGSVFTKNDIAKKIKDLFPESDANDVSVAALLWNMEKKKILEISERGGGRTPSKYKRTPEGLAGMQYNPNLEKDLSAVNGQKEGEAA